MYSAGTRVSTRVHANCHRCTVNDVVLFADLNGREFDTLRRPIDALHLGVGDVLYQPDDLPERIYTVSDGLIVLVQRLPDYGRRIVRLLKQGDVAGMELLLGQGYQHTAEALQPTRVCVIPVSVLEQLDRESPQLHSQLMACWQRALQQADFWITALSTGTAHARVARLLLWMRECCVRGLLYLPSREDLGAMLGLTTETVSRIVADYRRQGIIKSARGRGTRLNVPALRRLCTQ